MSRVLKFAPKPLRRHERSRVRGVRPGLLRAVVKTPSGVLGSLVDVLTRGRMPSAALEMDVKVASGKSPPASLLWWPPVLLLSVCWALAFSVLTACAASINLTGAELSLNSNLATMPLALNSLSTGMYNFVLPAEFAKLGRWGAYLLGAVIGMVGCVCCLLGCELCSFELLCLGAVQVGVALAHAQNFRFGVLLCVESAKAPVAISWVLAGGVAGAVLGPGFSMPAQSMLPTPYSGIFLVCCGCWLLLLLLLLGGAPLLQGLSLKPTTRTSDASLALPPRPLREVFAQPRCWACTFVASASYGVMVFFMAAVPLQMRAAGFSFAQSSLTVQLHMVMMFAPSFFTGHAIKRFGIAALQATGAVLLAGGGAVAWAGAHQAHFMVSQMVMGLGWNLCFVPATAGLSKQTRPSETARVQSANDVCIFLTSGSCMLLAGPALSSMGWASMQLVSYATSAVILLAVLLSEGLEARRRLRHEQDQLQEPKGKEEKPIV